MGSETSAPLTDDQLFGEVLRLRSEGKDFGHPLGQLCERWRTIAYAVVRRIQSSYRRRSADDQAEIYQDAVGKLLARGLDQFRGLSERNPGQAASPRTFFLRIVKHVAIDRYRRQHEELEPAASDDDEFSTPLIERVGAVERARHVEEKAEATELYDKAFERLKHEHPNEAQAWDLYHHKDVEDHEECARQLGITVANSYKRVSRAQAYLKLYLLELVEEEPSK
jgi:RNA polymerase sigma-70 factor (ECF subfamily)